MDGPTPFSGQKQEGEEGKKSRRVPLLKLFAFADLYDCLLMTIGSVGACIHGASVPVFFIFFGKLIDVIGMAYLFPQAASHKVAKVNMLSFRLTHLFVSMESGGKFGV